MAGLLMVQVTWTLVCLSATILTLVLMSLEFGYVHCSVPVKTSVKRR